MNDPQSTQGTQAAPNDVLFRIESMSLLDHRQMRFQAACAALTGLVANTSRGGTLKEYAADAVNYADALLARLDATQGKSANE